MIDQGKHNVLGVHVDAVDYDGAVEKIASAARDNQPFAVSALAVHGLMTGVLDEEHRFRLNHFDLLTPDGQPVRWALNWLHSARLADRVYGPNLMLKTCERAAAEGLPIFLFGGTEELLDKLVENLLAKFPELQIAGRRASRFRKLSAAERDEVVAEIKASGAKLTFVGLGCPRQEVWAFEHREALSMPILAVGAAFNFHAGQLDQAPKFLQDRGLEWAFRLAKEPLRLWRRYLLLNPMYVGLLTAQALRLRRFDPADCRQPGDEALYG
ncbi:MAG: WecB/TagA/CpsF family glycosyltransferase [Pirellulaceae bacterium]|jgi:exopolysaccharide biosynthesis WecB/TagA/CpsF family protein|nr:WecB/TagA/CpsF family glycosyltransferase [Pirellulaceae bacterium]MDP7016877.1 WecB/TagA/CpsF family glycosyltransferase [Pirellulaceae bacterium]